VEHNRKTFWRDMQSWFAHFRLITRDLKAAWSAARVAAR
jgi:hypothetical protein